MDVQVSMELFETLPVRVYRLDLTGMYDDTVMSNRSGGPTEVSGCLAQMCELIRQGSLGQFYRVDLRTTGLTCFIAGRNNDFETADNIVVGVIASILNRTVQLHVAASQPA